MLLIIYQIQMIAVVAERRIHDTTDGSSARARACSGRLAELAVLHPHLLCGLNAAAEFRWQSGMR